MEFRYSMPTEIYFGEDAVLKNKEVFSSIGKRLWLLPAEDQQK